MRVFVTVGSTQFNELVKLITEKAVLETLCSKGYQSLTIQTGNGSFIPREGKFSCVEIKTFKYKESLDDDIRSADLVISHAGAGSCVETLEANKPLLAVVNESLMGNHQKELAEAFSELGFCKWCNIENFLTTLKDLNTTSLKKYEPGNPQKLVDYIDSVFVFS